MTESSTSPRLLTATICGGEFGAAFRGMKSKEATGLLNILARIVTVSQAPRVAQRTNFDEYRTVLVHVPL